MKYVSSGPVYILDKAVNGEVVEKNLPTGSALLAAAAFADAGKESHLATKMTANWENNCIGQFIKDHSIVSDGKVVHSCEPHFLRDANAEGISFTSVSENYYYGDYALGFLTPRPDELSDSLAGADGLFVERMPDETFFRQLSELDNENGFEIMWLPDEDYCNPESLSMLQKCAPYVDGICMTFNNLIRTVSIGSYDGAISALESSFPNDLFIVDRSDCLTVIYHEQIAHAEYKKNLSSSEDRLPVASALVMMALQQGKDVREALVEAMKVLEA